MFGSDARMFLTSHTLCYRSVLETGGIDVSFANCADERDGGNVSCARGDGSSSQRPGVTGTLSGTVKDSQGLIVPGATVTLISDTRGTVSAPVFTNQSGDFVIPNIVADTYTVQVEMPSFRTLRRTGVEVSAGSRVSVMPRRNEPPSPCAS